MGGDSLRSRKRNGVKKMKSFQKVLAVVAVATFAPAAFAAGTYDGITAAVDWADVITALTAIGALIAAVLVVSRGTKMVLRMIGR